MEDLKTRLKELDESIALLDDDVNRLSCMEQAVKIVLNGGYGAIGASSFRYYDETIAEAITSTGRIAIEYITMKINEFLNKEVGEGNEIEPIDYIVSSDTDSVTGDTILSTSIGNITIEDLYNRYTTESLELESNKDSVRTLTENIKSASFDGNSVNMNNINYIMKHRVKKRMYQIRVKNDIVTITEDHSIMVMRDNELQSIKPKDILKTDKFVRLL